MPTEKDVEPMPTQKIFKQRVRARMTKTGESYTAARHQLLKKAAEPEPPEPAPQPDEAPAIPPEARLVADEAMLRATGKDHAEWFAILDAWGATAHNHTEIASWLSETQGTPGWWTQNITVSYERARGMRKPGQMANGFTVNVTRTIAVGAATVLEAFTNPAVRGTWLPDAPMQQRPTRATNTARFDWADPPSRVIVALVPKAGSRSTVAVAHEQLPDAETAERFKTSWRGWLGSLTTTLERS